MVDKIFEKRSPAQVRLLQLDKVTVVADKANSPTKLCPEISSTNRHFHFHDHFPGKPELSSSLRFSCTNSQTESLGLSDRGALEVVLPFLLPN